MLAASTTTGIVVGIIGLLILLGLLYVGFRLVVIAIRLLIRLVTWPFRALRTPPPTGAGADYEAMIRQQPRERPVTTSRLPFPPPSAKQQAAALPASTAQSSHAQSAAPPPLPVGTLTDPGRSDPAVFRYRKGWSWTLSIIVTLLPIGAILAIAQAIWGMQGQNIAGYVGYGLAAIYWLWSWRRLGRVPIIRIGSQVPGERAEFEAWRAARHDADLSEFLAWKTGQQPVVDEPMAPETKPSIDTF